MQEHRLLRVRRKSDQTKMKGFATISSVLVIGAAVLVIGIAVTLFSISEAQTALTGQRREEVIDLVEGCIEDSLYTINTQNIVNSTITLPLGTCSLTVNSHVGSVWIYTVSGTLNGFTKNFQITVTRSSILAPISWKEI